MEIEHRAAEVTYREALRRVWGHTDDERVVADIRKEIQALEADVLSALHGAIEDAAAVADKWALAYLDWVGGEVNPIEVARNIARQIRALKAAPEPEATT